jgi:hypothetical protein
MCRKHRRRRCKCKARCREKETKGFKTKPEIWVVTFATGAEENERLDIDL